MSKTFTYAAPAYKSPHAEARDHDQRSAADRKSDSDDSSGQHARANRRHVHASVIRFHTLPSMTPQNGTDKASGAQEPDQPAAGKKRGHGRALNRHLRAIAKAFGKDPRALRSELSKSGPKAEGRAPGSPEKAGLQQASSRIDYVKRAFRNLVRAITGSQQAPSAAH